MAKRSDGIKKFDDIDEKEFLSILDGRATPSALPKKGDPQSKLETKEEKENPEENVLQEQENEDEEEIIPSDRAGTPIGQKVTKPLSKRKQGEIYEYKFLQPRELKIRQCVYISRSVHETIADIVKRIGERGLTVGVYIDTILHQHLQEHKDEINTLYCKPTDIIIK